MDLNEIVRKIKEKKELSPLEDKFIISSIKPLLEKYPELSRFTPKTLRLFIKEARAKMRISSGMFQAGKSSFKKREGMLNSGRTIELLKTHVSSRERLADYSLLRKILEALEAKSILDIGCGLNPIAMASGREIYNACDINKEELALIREFFSKKGISGKVFSFDLNSLPPSLLPKSDVCIMWKLIDLLKEKSRRKIASLISRIPCRYLWISFSAKTLSGKPMRNASRRWIEKLLDEMGYKWLSFSIKNEIFYIISKNSIIPEAVLLLLKQEKQLQ